MEIEQQRKVFVNRAGSIEYTLPKSYLENDEAVIADFLAIEIFGAEIL